MLRIWLPLNGNLNQQGASGITATASNVTVNAAGKIGQCYSFNGSSSYIQLSEAPLDNNTAEFSFACWFKPTNAHNGCLYSNRTGTNSTGITLFYYTSQILFDAYDRWQFTPKTAITVGAWNHLAFTYKKGDKKKLYLNGILINETAASSTAPTTANATRAFIGASQSSSTAVNANYLNGALNDVRVYDHCLSDAEVKEIARGLVLHYKLDDAVGFTDSIQNQNTYAVYNNYSGSGTTGTLTNLNEYFYGNVVRRETMTPNDTSLANFKSALGSHGVYGHRQTFLANTKYVFWIYYRPVSHLDVRVGGTASNIGGWTEIPPVPVGNGWYRVGQYRNGTVTTDKTDSIFTSFYTPTAASGVPITIDWASPHLLTGTTEIPPYDFPLSIIEDSSGYNHKGAVAGAVKTQSLPARYSDCIYLPSGNTDYITTQDNVGYFTNGITMNIWFKSANKTPGADYHHCFNSLTSWTYIEMAVHKGGYLRCGLYINGTRYVANTDNTNLLDGNWHMLTMTYDGANVKRYVDGVLKSTQAATGNLNTSSDKFVFGRGANTGYYCKEAYLSDARLYVTGLDADAVLQLYHTSAKADNKHTLHTFELNENGQNKITKTGQLRCSTFSEFNGLSYLKYDPNVYIEPDGSCWVRLAHHNNPAANLFSSSDTFTTSVYKNADNWFNMEVCNHINKWEIMVKSKATTTATEYKYRWIQQYNPMTATYANVAAANVTKITTTGYSSYSWGGLYHIGSSTYLSANNGTSGNWWGAVGAWTAYSGGIPGWTTTITSGYQDVYVRIDNIEFTSPTIKSTKNNIWTGREIIEL